MTFNFLNQGQNTDITQVRPIDTFIDPVSKIRVSNPGNLIDTDFEYGLQPTKWETVEIINNTPAFFSKSGDTTIPDITGVTTNAGTREITVTTAFPHLLAVGIPIRVAGTKSLTADGSYIINATPTPETFTYLSRANQADTISIFDLYTSIITGEFFQGSQISISDSEGVVTDGQGPSSTLTVKTSNKHGFGNKTPFYFLNLNSTVSQEFESQNNTSLSFDPTNSATAQTFDGSNTLLQTPIDLSNSATNSIYENNITSTDAQNATITVNIAAGDEDNWDILKIGDPLYHNVNVGSGYFQSNPKGVVFISNVDGIDTANNTATFQVSDLPDGDPLSILANMTGYFQISNQAKTFAGNNVDIETQINLNIEIDQEIVFDGGNQGYNGDPEEPQSNTATVVGYTGTNVTVFTSEAELDYYVGAMLKYESDGDSAEGLNIGSTYFVFSFSEGASPGLYNMSLSELPGEYLQEIEMSGGSGSQTFSKIGVAVDKNIWHVQDANYSENDMIEYSPSVNGSVTTGSQKNFFFVENAYDSHNYTLRDLSYIGSPGQAEFVNPGSFTWTAPDGVFSVCAVCVGGGGGGSEDNSGDGGNGGGGGGVGWKNDISVTPGQDYDVVVGQPGAKDTNNGATSNATGGGDSYFISASTVAGLGGGGATGNGGSSGGFVGDGGGNGGTGGTGSSSDAGGGGGAGGYIANGGRGAQSNNYGTSGDGGGGGGGGAGGSNDAAGGGGGVGIYGIGASGRGGFYNGGNGGGGDGGSGGEDGINGDAPSGDGGDFGGGGGGAENTSNENGNGGGGAVRIIWGENRSFPYSKTEDV